MATAFFCPTSVLGLGKMARPSTSVAIFATGNNLEVKGDTTRRILCKLDARKGASRASNLLQ
jgi:hypothetical protein